MTAWPERDSVQRKRAKMRGCGLQVDRRGRLVLDDYQLIAVDMCLLTDHIPLDGATLNKGTRLLVDGAFSVIAARIDRLLVTCMLSPSRWSSASWGCSTWESGFIGQPHSCDRQQCLAPQTSP